MKPAEFLNELSNEKLAKYKTAAAADAKKADSEGDYKRGDKRFSGIVKATKKQFANDEKKEVDEAYGRNSYAYRKDGGANDERHDLDPSDWYFVKDGKMFAISVYPRQEQEAIARGYSRTRAEAKAKADQQGMTEDLDENLHKWFKEKWVRFGPDGKIRGDCARGDDSEGKPKCLPQSKAQNLGKKGRASAAARKRREDPNPERSGKAINVNTKKKTNEAELDEACWKGYHKEGNKKMFGKTYPNCVKNTNEEQELDEYGDTPKGQKMLDKVHHRAADRVTSKKADTDPHYARKVQQTQNRAYDRMKDVAEEHHSESCPHCGGEMVSEELMNEKKDACYYKVKSRYKVWPSAYASGALVKCRKKGASNWGNGGKSNESVAEDDAGDVEQRMIAKITKYKEHLAHLKKTDPEAYKREMEKRKTSSRVPPVSTFEDQGVAEGFEFQDAYGQGYDDGYEGKGYNSPFPVGSNEDDEYEDGYGSGRLDYNKMNRDLDEQGVAEDQLDEKWTKKYKDSINCSNPKGFSQKAHCAGKQKNESVAVKESAILQGLKKI